MEGDCHDPSAGIQPADCRFQTVLKRIQFIIYSDTDGLENLTYFIRCSGSYKGQGFPYGLGQVEGGFQGSSVPTIENLSGYPSGRFDIAVVAQHLLEFFE
jgi:hypothetical protein